DKALGRRLGLLLLDVDAVDGTGAGALVAADAGGQVKAMVAAVARLHGHRQLGIFVAFCEGLATIGLDEVPEGYVHALRDRADRQHPVVQPRSHRGFSLSRPAHWREKSVTFVDYRTSPSSRKCQR